MDDLVTWLRAQLDEDERVARAIAAPDWTEGAAWLRDMIDPLPSQLRAHPGMMPMNVTEEDVRHIARWDPRRVLREIEAKRRIIYELGAQASRYRDGDPTTIISPEGRALANQARRYLRLLALPYADRPGYRDEWRP